MPLVWQSMWFWEVSLHDSFYWSEIGTKIDQKMCQKCETSKKCAYRDWVPIGTPNFDATFAFFDTFLGFFQKKKKIIILDCETLS